MADSLDPRIPSNMHVDPHTEVDIGGGVMVDAGVIDLVNYVNTIPGVRTNNSCQGDPRDDVWLFGWQMGYVAFDVDSLEVLQALARRVFDWNEPYRSDIWTHAMVDGHVSHSIWWTNGPESAAKLLAHLKAHP